MTTSTLLGDNAVVSSSEPIGKDKKKIWFQNGKNLFNYKAGMYLNAFINTSSKKIEESNAVQGHILAYIKCSPNTTYTLSKKAGHSFRVATFTKVPAWGVSYNNTVANHTGTTITITTGKNDNYLGFVCFALTDGDTGDYIDMYSTLQVEQNATATSYASYIKPTIYIKDSNNVYQEFEGALEEGFVNCRDYIEFNSKITQINLFTVYKKGNIIYINLDLQGKFSKGETVIGTFKKSLKAGAWGSGRSGSTDGSGIIPATYIMLSNGAVRVYTTAPSITTAGSIMCILDE